MSPNGSKKHERLPTLDPLPRQSRTLNLKQERFVSFYLNCLNAGEAYKAAGYEVASDEVAASAGRRLLRNVAVMTAINDAQLERQGRLQLDGDQLVARLHVLYMTAQARGDVTAAVSALREIGKLLGCYERHQQQKQKYTRDDMDRLRTELEAAGMSFEAVNMPKPSAN